MFFSRTQIEYLRVYTCTQQSDKWYEINDRCVFCLSVCPPQITQRAADPVQLSPSSFSVWSCAVSSNWVWMYSSAVLQYRNPTNVLLVCPSVFWLRKRSITETFQTSNEKQLHDQWCQQTTVSQQKESWQDKSFDSQTLRTFALFVQNLHIGPCYYHLDICN